MLSLDEARELVARRGWLARCSPEFRDAVVKRCVLRNLAGGAIINLVGDPPGGIFGLVSGSIGVSIAPGENGPYFAHVMQAGEWFGEGPAITGGPRMVGHSARSECQILYLSLPAIKDITREDPGAWRFIAALSNSHLEMAVGGADDLMIRDHVRRLIAILLRLGGCRRTTPPGSKPITVDANQEDLARMANLSRNSAGKVLRDLEAAGLVSLSYRRVRIIDADTLRARLASE
jgi:CRP-like cAMP-binding protein